MHRPTLDASARRSGEADGASDQDRETAIIIERLSPLVAAENLPQVAVIVEETIAQVTMHHSGPLPRASELARYKDIDPTFAERIVQMAEREQRYRHSLPASVIEREYRLKSRGQICALVIAVAVLCFAALLAWFGDTNMGGKVALGTLVGLVGIFVGGRVVDVMGDRRRETEGD